MQNPDEEMTSGYSRTRGKFLQLQFAKVREGKVVGEVEEIELK